MHGSHCNILYYMMMQPVIPSRNSYSVGCEHGAVKTCSDFISLQCFHLHDGYMNSGLV